MVTAMPRSMLFSTVLALSSASSYADEQLPLEVYGALPEMSLVTMSPSGDRVAFRAHLNGMDRIAVIEVASGNVIVTADSEDVNPRYMEFANENHLLLRTSERFSSSRRLNAFEKSTVYDFDLTKQKIRRPLDEARAIHEFQSGLGGVSGRTPDAASIFMPAFIDFGGPVGTYGLYRVDLDKKRPRWVERGTPDTIGWFLNENGDALVREDFAESEDRHNIWRVDGDDPKLLFEDETPIRKVVPVGLVADRSALVVRVRPVDSDTDKYFALSLDTGTMSGPILSRDDVVVDDVVKDINHVVLGVRYTGFMPSYSLLDEELDARVATIQKRLVGMYSELVAWSDDKRKLVFLVRGSWSAGDYLLFEAGDPTPRPLGGWYPKVTADDIATVRITEYEARDGLTIPALITAKKDVYEAGNAPLVLMPHGGPEFHDEFGFDWMAQYFASRGYVVLQPQFRGSTGFGNAHRLAGRGEWGGKMQSDLDDGVMSLVEDGLVDPERVCVVGASYGGYAALAAGALSPAMYRCIVSFAGVSDLGELLEDEAKSHGKDNWVVAYWESQVGGGMADKAFLRSISPAQLADNFEAPVLLLHGKNDTVVSRDQSKRMERALKKAGKEVTYKLLKGEDHWLTQEATRVETLRLMSEFIRKHNPPEK